jgi:hypothetical protein
LAIFTVPDKLHILIQRIIYSCIKILLYPIERNLKLKFKDAEIKHPPVFVIGAPRSGSTLLYKALTERFKLSYFSNFTAKFFRTPLCGMWLQKALHITSRRGDYNFNYGQVKGLGSPSECGEFWYRWFPRGLHVYVAPGETPAWIRNELRSEIGEISAISKQPMLFKNLYNSMRIAPIVESIPEASFIVCHRDQIDNALSIMQGRTKKLNSKDKWWSLPPKEIEQLKDLAWPNQIAGQIYYIYKQIEEDKKRYGSERFLDIKYENFCNDVHSSVVKINKFLAARGCHLEEKHEIPKFFHIRRNNKIDAGDKTIMRQAFNDLTKVDEK